MKKLFFIPFTLLSLNFFSQTIVLKNADTGFTLAPNATVPKTTSPDANFKVTLDIKNISATTQTYTAKRYDVLLNTDAPSTTTASAYFCFGGNCYGASTIVSPNNLVLNSGQSASEIVGLYYMLIADLDEASVVGESRVKYTFANVNAPNDTVQITIKYNGTTLYNISTSYGFGSVTASSGTTDPTPVTSTSGISFGPFSAVGTSSNPVGANTFAFSGWPLGATNGSDTPASMTGQISLNNYYSITVSPAPGYFTSLTGITFDVDRSATGSRNYAVRSSADAYTANLPTSALSNTNLSVNNSNVFTWNYDAMFSSPQGTNGINLSANAYKNFTSPITFRFYSWNAEDANGTFGIDNVVFQGLTSLYITGIGEISQSINTKLRLYPNPSNNGIVTLEATSEFSKVELISAMGSLIFSQNVSAVDGKANLDLSNVPSGIYYVKIIHNNKSSVEKLVITKS